MDSGNVSPGEVGWFLGGNVIAFFISFSSHSHCTLSSAPNIVNKCHGVKTVTRLLNKIYMSETCRHFLISEIMEQHQIYAVLGFLVLLWCFHQSNALQEGEQYEQLTRGRGRPWWERGIMMCCLCYTDDERGVVIISNGFESYHLQCTFFFRFTSYIWSGTHSHL